MVLVTTAPPCRAAQEPFQRGWSPKASQGGSLRHSWLSTIALSYGWVTIKLFAMYSWNIQNCIPNSIICFLGIQAKNGPLSIRTKPHVQDCQCVRVYGRPGEWQSLVRACECCSLIWEGTDMGLSVTRWGRFRELVQALRLVRLLRESLKFCIQIWSENFMNCKSRMLVMSSKTHLLADALTGAQRFIFSICYFIHKQVIFGQFRLQCLYLCISLSSALTVCVHELNSTHDLYTCVHMSTVHMICTQEPCACPLGQSWSKTTLAAAWLERGSRRTETPSIYIQWIASGISKARQLWILKSAEGNFYDMQIF